MGRIQEVGLQAFIDDLSIWASGDFHNREMHWWLRVALRVVGDWIAFWRIVFLVAKCEVILFCSWQT